jgi:predicted deacetylase
VSEPSEEALRMARKIAANRTAGLGLEIAAALQKLMDERDDRVKYAGACELGAQYWKQRAEAAEAELVADARRHAEQLEAVRKRAEAAEERVRELVRRMWEIEGSDRCWGEVFQLLKEHDPEGEP